MRYVLIDKITELVVGRRLKGIKNVTFSDGLNRPFGDGWTALPAAFLLESMAQAAGLLVAASSKYRAQPVLAKVQHMRVIGTASAGDQIEVVAEIEEMKDAGAKVNATATAGKIALANATIYLALIPLDQLFGDQASKQNNDLVVRLRSSFPGWFEEGKATRAAI